MTRTRWRIMACLLTCGLGSFAVWAEDSPRGTPPVPRGGPVVANHPAPARKAQAPEITPDPHVIAMTPVPAAPPAADPPPAPPPAASAVPPIMPDADAVATKFTSPPNAPAPVPPPMPASSGMTLPPPPPLPANAPPQFVAPPETKAVDVPPVAPVPPAAPVPPPPAASEPTKPADPLAPPMTLAIPPAPPVAPPTPAPEPPPAAAPPPPIAPAAEPPAPPRVVLVPGTPEPSAPPPAPAPTTTPKSAAVAEPHPIPPFPWKLGMEFVGGVTHLEVRRGDELLMKVQCEKLDLHTPMGGIHAAGKVIVSGPCVEARCERLMIAWQTGQVALDGSVSLSFQNRGTVQVMRAESLTFRLTGASTPVDFTAREVQQIVAPAK